MAAKRQKTNIMEKISRKEIHDNRRNQIIDCAASLFMTYGYEKTSIQMILDRLNIAKGTFYHYFESKLDMLNSFADREIKGILENLESIVSDKTISAADKINLYFSSASNWKIQNWELVEAYIIESGKPENQILFRTLLEDNIKWTLPLFTRLIAEGVEEGVFRTSCPDIAAETIIRLGVAINDQLRASLLSGGITGKKEMFMKIMDFYQDTIAKILGTEKNILRLWDRDAFAGRLTHLSAGNISQGQGKGRQT